MLTFEKLTNGSLARTNLPSSIVEAHMD